VETMQITEPATMITDYLLALASVAFGVSLLRLREQRPALSLTLWVIGFLASAIAAIVGGTYHGFALYVSAPVHRAMWNLTVLLIGVSAGLFIAAILSKSQGTPGQKEWLVRGVLLSMFGLLVQQSGLSLFRNFNHNDMYHCIQAIAFYGFFRSARGLP
jgi:hypothetical protein